MARLARFADARGLNTDGPILCCGRCRDTPAGMGRGRRAARLEAAPTLPRGSGRAGARRGVPGRPAGAFDLIVERHRAPCLSAVLPLRRQPRRRQRPVAGRVPARVSGAAEFSRPVVAGNMAVSHRRQRLPEPRRARRRRSTDRADRRTAARRHAQRVGVRQLLKGERAARACARRSRSCPGSSARR